MVGVCSRSWTPGKVIGKSCTAGDATTETDIFRHLLSDKRVPSPARLKHGLCEKYLIPYTRSVERSLCHWTRLARKVENVLLADPDGVKDSAHIGTSDFCPLPKLVRRYLEFKGPRSARDEHHDVEDKSIKPVREAKTSRRDYTSKYEGSVL